MSYASTIFAEASLKAHWRLGEISGTTATDQTGNNNGTYIGTPTLGIAGALSNDSDKAVNFSGANTEGVNFAASASLNTLSTAATWEAWLKPDASSLSVRREVVIRANASDDWWWNLQSAKLALFMPGGITGGVYKLSTASIVEAVWTYVVTTWDGSNVRHYINAVLDSTQAASGTLPASSTQTGAIGYNRPAPGGTASYKGGIDEVAIYNTALSGASISAHYAAGVAALQMAMII